MLSPQIDPYRLDTESGHRDGKWIADHLASAVQPNKQIHWGGLHYVIVAQGDIVKPNGEIYINDDDNCIGLPTSLARRHVG